MMPTATDSPSPDAGLTVRLLVREPFYMDRDGRPRSGRPLALLAYLLLSRTPPSRDELLELLWDPRPGQDVHNRLRTLLHQVRKEVGRGIIQMEGRDLRIDPEHVRCDAAEFLARLDSGDIDAAMELYEAPLLMRGCPADAPVFEDWAASRRAEIDVAYRHALLREADSAAAVDPERYSRLADALLLLDPTDPLAAEHGLCAALSLDDAAAIGQAARRFRTAHEVAGIPFSRRGAELLALTDARERTRTVSAAVAFDPPFAGRATELGVARSILARTRLERRGGLIGVAGQSGVGKTRFLRETERLARVDGMRVLRGRAYEVDSRTPYAVLVDALRPLFEEIPMRLVPPGTLETLGAIMPEFRPTGAESREWRTTVESVQIHAAVVSLLENVALDSPLVLLIDDVHWADEQSRACLHRVALRTTECPLVLAMAFRDAHERLVAPLFAAAPVDMCRLQPLTPAEVDELLGGLASFPGPVQRERLVRTMLASSGGSPLQLIQHLSHLHEAGLVTVGDGVWQLHGQLLESEPGAPAEPVVALITRRLEALSESEQKVLAACAVLERYAPPREIAAVAGLKNARIADQLDVLARQRLVQAEGPLVSVAHGEIGNAALRMIHGHRRQEMFEEALRHAENNGILARPGISNLARLRLACGAGDRQRARLALLELLSDVVHSHGERLPAVAEAVLLSARDWCPSPDFFAQVYRDGQRATDEPDRIDLDIRGIRRRRSAKRAILRADRLIPVGALALAGTLLVLNPVTRSINDRRHFGGGGLIVLQDSTGAPHAVRFIGGGAEDTVPVRHGVPILSSPLDAPLLSPDGSHRLVRCVPDGGGPPDVCIETVDGDDRFPLSPSPGNDSPLGWSPDGRFALISSDRGSDSAYSYDLFTVDAATGSAHRISDDPYQTDHGMWSPDGTRIAYRSNGPDGGAVVVADIAGRKIATFEMMGSVGSPNWSPDGKQIAFGTVALDGRSQIYIAETAPAGLSIRPVRDSDRLLSPLWSPDGRFIAASLFETSRLAVQTRILLVADSSDVVVATFRGGTLAWIPEHRSPYLDRIVAPERVTALAGEPIRLVIAALASDQTPIDVPQLDLVPADRAITASLGGDTLVAMAPGRTSVEVTAGGWRSARVDVVVSARDSARPVFAEDWASGIDTARWKPYGSPPATVVATPLARRCAATEIRGIRAA